MHCVFSATDRHVDDDDDDDDDVNGVIRGLGLELTNRTIVGYYK